MFYTYVQFEVYTEDRLICFSDETYVPTIKKKTHTTATNTKTIITISYNCSC